VDLNFHLNEYDFGREDEPDVVGVARIEPSDDAVVIELTVRPETSPQDLEDLTRWAAERTLRFLEHGPEPDGWQKRSGGDGWQLWVRRVILPAL
jgi:hypothetical protein